MRSAACSAAALLCLTLATAHGHAYLAHVEPGDDGFLAAAPDMLALDFTMAVEPRFSRFEVHRLDVDADALPDDPATPTERERQRLNALAARLAAQVLERDRDEDHPDRVDDGTVTLSERNTVVTVDLNDDLPSGVYVLVWEVLAVDAHWTSGHLLLLIADPVD